MKEERIKVILPEGVFYTNVLTFSESDRKFIFEVYKEWRALSNNLLKIKSRAVNLPEGLSEGTFCLEMNAVRIVENISGANTSFDCYNQETQERIQVKGCSVLPDLTSFGPKSVWDKIYFVDFYRKGLWDGTFDIYLLDNKNIYNQVVNQQKNETFCDQQRQGRRPRFSIYSEIIQPKKLIPIKTCRLSDGQ